MNGLTNGHASSSEPPAGPRRFADIPRAIDIPVSGGDTDEAVEVDLEELLDDPTELCTLLENENVGKGYWTMIALAYAKQSKLDLSIEIINRGLSALSRGNPREKLGLYNCLCWLYFLKARDAPRIKTDATSDSSVQIKDYYLRAATSAINEASRINPTFAPLYLARGVLSLLRAALLQDQNEKSDTLRQALKNFNDALRTSRDRNMMAILGRSRAYFSLGKYADAIKGYQEVLQRAPDVVDPDPRIGIGCCLWQLGHRDDASAAWQRALDLNPESKIANILLGLCNLHASAQFPTADPQFTQLYKKAMVQFTQKAFKLDNDLPLACATFGSYFLVRKAMPKVETLARKAIELTDVNAIASDGWYLLARKEHYSDDLAKASDFYLKADQARGGDERGYLPAKFGAAQLRVLQKDLDGAKFRLEKIIQQHKSIEAMTLLGTLFAEDVFNNQGGMAQEELATAAKRATSLLESVRVAWKDPSRNLTTDSSVLLNLARLYEVESPDKSLQCLLQVEQMELEDIPDELRPIDVEDEATMAASLRELLPPQLLNNIACFHYHADRLVQARETFQTALNACIKVGDKEQTLDTDALVTTISFNLARTYEAENMLDEAKKVYQGLLDRHADYVDAKSRLTYIALRQSPGEDGPKAMASLYEAESSNLEVRSLFGWYLKRAKRRAANIAEDQEQRHFKHTLQNHDKHDRYALTGMGNLYLGVAREMRRDTDQEKDKRHKMYEKAVEFFDKALQLDPRNGYAAQGIGIAMVEDKKDFGAALQIFSKVRETVKESCVYINLGHIYCELKQYSRAIESYDAALAKDRGHDPQVLACLGRVWLLRGKQEKSTQAMKTSLDFSQRASEIAPDQQHFRFNVAYVQIQIAQLVITQNETQRSSHEVEAATEGLDQAIESLGSIAKSPNPPFPRHDIEQRANMARNTMRRQLDRAGANQKEYEEKNATRLQNAREARDAEMARRAEDKRQADAAVDERRRQLREKREEMARVDRELADARAADEERRLEEEFSVDDETGERRKKTRKAAKRKKKADDGIDDRDVDRSSATPAADDDDERPRQKKKRRLLGKGRGTSAKHKSAELAVDTDDSDEDAAAHQNGNTTDGANGLSGDEDETMPDEAEGADVPQRKTKKRIVDDDDDDDDQDAAPATNGSVAAEEDDET